MKLVRWPAMTLAILLIAGCATRVEFEVARAPEIRVANLSFIKIDKFDLDRECSRRGGVALAMYPDYLRRTLATGAYKVKESENFDARLSGQISCNLVIKSTTREVKKDGKVKVETSYDRQADLAITFTLYDKSGKELGTARVRDYETDSSTYGAMESLIDTAMTKTATELLQKISPYIARQRLALESGDSNIVKDGVAAAEKGDWPQAVRLWNQGAASGNEVDKIASLYNLAVYDEYLGNLEEARKKYEDVLVRKPESKYQRTVTRIRALIEEQGWLKQNSPFGVATK